jgi:hypothetical protein
MPAHTDLDHPHVHLTLDFIVLLLGRALLLLADPAAKAAAPCNEGPAGSQDQRELGLALSRKPTNAAGFLEFLTGAHGGANDEPGHQPIGGVHHPAR